MKKIIFISSLLVAGCMKSPDKVESLNNLSESRSVTSLATFLAFGAAFFAFAAGFAFLVVFAFAFGLTFYLSIHDGRIA